MVKGYLEVSDESSFRDVVFVMVPVDGSVESSSFGVVTGDDVRLLTDTKFSGFFHGMVRSENDIIKKAF